jgi:hypothetical protein
VVKSIVAYCSSSVPSPSPARRRPAVRYCPPIPVQVVAPFASCKCAVQNYSTVADTGVTISVLRPQRRLHDVRAEHPAARTGTFCHVSIALGTMWRLRGDRRRGHDPRVPFG